MTVDVCFSKRQLLSSGYIILKEDLNVKYRMYSLHDRTIPVLSMEVSVLCSVMFYGEDVYRLNQDIPRSLQKRKTYARGYK